MIPKKNIQNYSERKSILLKKIVDSINNTEVDDLSFRQELAFATNGYEMDKSKYKFDYYLYLSESICSFCYKNTNIDKDFIGFIGLSESDMNLLDTSFTRSEYINNLSRETSNISLYIKAIVDLDIPVMSTVGNYYIIDNIVSTEIEEVDFNAVNKCFGEFYSIELKKDYITLNNENDFYQILSNILVDSGILVNNTIKNLKFDLYDIINESNINYHHLLLGLVSNSFEDMFLNFYKILESLFPIFFYDNLYLFFKDKSIKIKELAVKLEEEANVRASEKESIKRIFEFYSKGNDISIFRGIFHITQDEIDKGIDIARISEAFYYLRNSYVHGRWAFTTSEKIENHKNYQEFDREEWIKIIDLELDIIKKCLKHAKDQNYFSDK